MPMYNLIEYSINYSKTSGILWQYCKNIPAVVSNGYIATFNEANATDSFSSKAKITGQTDDDGEIDNIEIMVPLKYVIKMGDFHKTSSAYPNFNALNIPLNDQQHFKLNKINNIEDYFVAEIKESE